MIGDRQMINWNKKEIPFLGYGGFGGTSSGLAFAGSSSVDISNEYFYLPFNESSSSRSKFGNYASSITINSGGTVASDHPYTITDTTYNSGNAKTHHCDGQSDTAYLSANTKLGSVGTGDLCFDMYYKWVSEGNGGGSYGYVGDYAGMNLYPSHTGISNDNYIGVGAIGSNILGRYNYQATGTENWNDSITTNGSGMNVWYHLLVIRQSNKWYSFVDGVLDGYFAEPSSRNIANGGGFHFGTIDRSGHWWDAYVSDFMWQKGSDIFYNVSGLDASDIGTTYFAVPKYKNKLMAIPSNSNFSIVLAPTGFTSS